MLIAGDLDQDGFNDVIISAPFAYDQQGTVYIYNGQVDGVSKMASQVICIFGEF